MKSFRTILPPFQASFSITHQDRVLLAGSCFTENIGARLAEGKFNIRVNPNGIVYNPLSVARSVDLSARVADDLLFERDGLWHSWQHHGAFSHPDREVVFKRIESSRRQTLDFLQTTTCLVLTLGTAEVFVLRRDGQVVANNHKAPADWFEQRRLTVQEVVEQLEQTLKPLKALSPALQVLLTVSPVRHIRMGLVENQRSKAVLLLACQQLCAQLDFVHYFPAYELMMDDLRDYRFYAADMIHPNEVAVDYIWDYFAEAFFSPATQKLLEQINRIRTAARHRPFHAQTAAFRSFASQQLANINQVAGAHPELDFSEEMNWFKQFCP